MAASESRRGLPRALRPASPLVKLDEGQLDALRAQCAEEIRERLAQAGDKHVGELVQQANDSYQEQDKRAQRAESRAATILTAASPLMGLVATVGSLQLKSSGPVPLPLAHRVVLAIFLLLVMIPLIMAARYALEVTTAQHGWSRPDSWPLVASRAGLNDEFTVQTLAALGAAAQYNSSIGDWKFERLGQARRMFRFGLVMLLAHPLSVLALAVLGVEF